MSEKQYKAVCHDCDWERTGASYHNRPYDDYKHAKRAVNGHLGHNNCDPEKASVEEISDDE